MSMLQFVHTSQQDMHVHQWLHHLAGSCAMAKLGHGGGL